MAARKVIVFGPTGAVGSSAARTAEELGATVVLAMRDTEKPIPGIDAEAIKKGKFEKVSADLTKPDSVREAVSTTGAKYAFMYCAHGSPDHMKSTIEALKAAGIELVVLLSSFTVREDPKAVQPSDIIPYLHAQVEINLTEVFGQDGFVALRPGSFASNQLQHRAGLASGQVRVFMPDATVDCIVPEDIGRVCGTVLAKGPQDDNRTIYLYGPELLSSKDCIKVIAKALGKDPEIKTASADEAYTMFTEELKVPVPLAKYMIAQSGKTVTGEDQVFGYPVSKEELSNVEKYSGKKGMTFDAWVEQNKQKFVA